VTCDGPVTIASEADLVAFAAQGCEVLNGSLTVSSPTLDSLDALAQSSLLIVTGDLAFDTNPLLANIAGIAGLEEVRGSLVFANDDVLGDLAGLESLRRVGSNSTANTLVLTNNAALTSVAALGGVERLLLGVVVTGNDALTSLAGVHHVRATQNVVIAVNGALKTLGGLEDLEEVGNFTLSTNPLLETCVLPSLTTVESLSITSHQSLTSVDISKLASADVLTIAANDLLSTIGDVDALMSVSMLVITGNPALPQCEVDALDARLMACGSSCGGNDPAATCN